MVLFCCQSFLCPFNQILHVARGKEGWCSVKKNTDGLTGLVYHVYFIFTFFVFAPMFLILIYIS